MAGNSSKDSLGSLIAGARAGDGAARDALFRQLLPDLRAFVRLRTDAALRLRESQSDLVQSICREVLTDLDGFEYRGPGRFRSWMFTLALNKLREKSRFHLAERRTPEREERPGPDDDLRLLASYCNLGDPGRLAIAHEDMAAFEEAFDQLERPQQDVILWSRLVGLPHAEIARKLDRSEQAVRSLLSRALVRLSSLLDARR